MGNFQKLKTSYQNKTLGEVVDFIDGDRGTNYPSQGEFFPAGDCLFLSTKNVPNRKFSFGEKQFITKDKDAVLRKGKLKRGDYVLTTRGTVGNFAYYDKSVPYENVRINSGMVILRKKSDALDEKFFRYYLSSDSFAEQVKSRVSGSAQPQLPIRDMISMEVKLPDLNTQARIASVLSAYDDLIENNEKRIKVLEEMAQLLYSEWFVKFKFPGNEKSRMVESGTEFGVVPEGWEVKRLGDIAKEIRISVNPNTLDSETPYVGLEHIPRKTILLSDWGKAGDVLSGKLEFKIGDILFGKIRPYFHKVASSPLDGISSSDTVIIRANNCIFQPLVLMCVSSENFVSYATNNSQGTKMPRADWKSMSKYLIVIPDEKNLNIFSQKINIVVSQINSLMFQNRNLSETRDFLIPQLVSGKKEIS